MSAVAKLLAKKEQLQAQLEADQGSNEAVEIQALLAKIDTALKLLGDRDWAVAGGKCCPNRHIAVASRQRCRQLRGLTDVGAASD